MWDPDGVARTPMAAGRLEQSRMMTPFEDELFLDNDPGEKQTGPRDATLADICPADPEPLFSAHNERNKVVWGGRVRANTGVGGYRKPPTLS